MQAFQCDKCEKFVAGTPDSRIGEVPTELQGEPVAVVVLATVLYTDEGEELELCAECRFALTAAAVQKESA